MQWFHDQWVQYEEKAAWISRVKEAVRELWLEYKGKSFCLLSPLSMLVAPQPLAIKEKIYTSARAYKRLKTTY